MVAVLKILQVILALSVLILIHELGHFTFAKLFGIRVDKFFLFFDIGGTRLLSTKRGWFSKLFPSLKERETEYGIGWLPLGGYCKIAGMVDESMDTSNLEKEAQPWEFRSKKAWKRLLVMAGGVLFNFILAVILFIVILNIWGTTYVSVSDNRIYVNELSYQMGFRSGDRILLYDDYAPENFLALQSDLARRDVSRVKVEREGDTLDIYIDKSMFPKIISSGTLFDLAVPFVVDTVPPSSPNYFSGYLRGDRIIALDTAKVEFIQDSRLFLDGKPFSEFTATVVRGADTLQLPFATDSMAMGRIYAAIPGLQSRDYGILESIPAGVALTFTTIGNYLRDLKMVASPSTGAYKSVGSFISIGQAFPDSWDWYNFLQILALLSVMLGVMNLLPVPALDGGHIVFVIYEMITGRKPGLRFMEAAQMVGMVLIFALMIFACGNDIGRLLH